MEKKTTVQKHPARCVKCGHVIASSLPIFEGECWSCADLSGMEDAPTTTPALKKAVEGGRLYIVGDSFIVKGKIVSRRETKPERPDIALKW